MKLDSKRWLLLFLSLDSLDNTGIARKATAVERSEVFVVCSCGFSVCFLHERGVPAACYRALGEEQR